MSRLVAALLAVTLSGAAAADTLLYAGRMIDGLADDARDNVTLRIRDQRIVAIDDGFVAPGEGDDVIDLRTSTVLPGLIDLHTHLISELGPKSYQERFTLNDADFALQAQANGMRTLRAGFTTVRDLGDTGNVTVALRDAIRRGVVDGPRIYTAAKSLATTGGHADPTNGWAKRIAGDPGPANGVVNGVADARKGVRQRYKDRADWIKITATGGVLSLAKSGLNPQFTDEELVAIVETGRDYGFKVAAHAHGADGMLRAVRAGVATIEHGTYMTPEVMRAMRQNGTYYVPTILAGNFVAQKAADPDFFPALVRPKAATIGPQIRDTFAAAYRAGVPIAFGTDSGVSPHGMNAREFELMVAAGMPAMEAIQSATSVAAVVLGAESDIGTLAAGRYADVIAVNEDPLSDIRALQDVDFVMKNGRVVKR
ncbi:MAG: amidohydrolase family protein [Pseudomonadota bacterium]